MQKGDQKNFEQFFILNSLNVKYSDFDSLGDNEQILLK